MLHNKINIILRIYLKNYKMENKCQYILPPWDQQ